MPALENHETTIDDDEEDLDSDDEEVESIGKTLEIESQWIQVYEDDTLLMTTIIIRKASWMRFIVDLQPKWVTITTHLEMGTAYWEALQRMFFNLPLDHVKSRFPLPIRSTKVEFVRPVDVKGIKTEKAETFTIITVPQFSDRVMDNKIEV